MSDITRQEALNILAVLGSHSADTWDAAVRRVGASVVTQSKRKRGCIPDPVSCESETTTDGS